MPDERPWLYFGCHREAGHYLWLPGMRHTYAIKFGLDKLVNLDGQLVPKGINEAQQLAAFSRLGGYRYAALSWWDRSVDKRGACNSTVFAPEPIESAEAMLAEARQVLQLALDHAQMSKDPSTRVGSIIVGPDREIISAGFNGFPRGIADTAGRLNDRDTKLRLMVHGEMNAVLAAARTGIRLKGCVLYLSATDDSGMVWGGPPCTRCTVEIIQAGITEIVSFEPKQVPSRWHADLTFARSLIAEAGVAYRELTP